MITPRKEGDLNVKFRPYTFDEMLGNDNIRKMLSNAIKRGKLPHALLFTGPSGCGKTTAARIIAVAINCIEGRDSPTVNPCFECSSCKSILNINSFAVMEVNAAQTSDVATIRQIVDDLPAAPLGNEKYKVLIIDEAHNLSGKAEDAVLKALEDTPRHVYIILCTNIANKLKEVTRNRCKTVQFGRLENKYIYELLEQVCQYEGFEYEKEVLDYTVKESHGVPRQALTYLQLIAMEGSWTKEAASMIINSGIDIDHAEVMALCRGMLKRPIFKELLVTYNKFENIPPENVRIHVRGWFVGCLKKARTIADANKFSAIIDLLEKPYYYAAKPEHDLINAIFKIAKIMRGENV